ncbi:MAG: hypothetical protein ACERKD_21430 [Prolixibacteraceae bacterium]
MNLIKAKAWAGEMDVMLTVCDLNGIIVYMNQASILGFHKYGGAELIGHSMLSCHIQKSQERIKEMLLLPQINTYIINKDNERRLIRQFPWVENGETKGIIELSFEIPVEIYERH